MARVQGRAVGIVGTGLAFVGGGLPHHRRQLTEFFALQELGDIA